MIIQKQLHKKMDNLMSVQSDMTYRQQDILLNLTQILEKVQNFDWKTLKALNENIMKVFTGIEDLNINLEKLVLETHLEAQQVHSFVEQFDVVTEIETDNKDSKILGYKDGSDIYSLTKTQEKEHDFVPLGEVSPDDLEKAARKMFHDSEEPKQEE